MSEIMTPISFEKLVNWMLCEYRSNQSVFGLKSEKFYKNETNNSISLLGETMSSPLGVAAGPNTQLAQNILVSYLSGLKFIELKTVQTIDGEQLRSCISRPCIKAETEGYNCEWSTELTCEQALCEYIKAWFLVHIARIEFGISEYKDFLFNMSVGYDFEGITSDKIDSFILSLKDAHAVETFNDCFDYLFANIDLFCNLTKKDLLEISPKICSSITLSTLHGCPPEEIEKIAKYFIEEKELHTYIKLNPTVLGYDKTKDILEKMNYTNIDFDTTHFEQDLKYEDAIPMIKRLKKSADKKGLVFGVKITNTFPVKSNGQLPSEYMYMSGKSLYPLSINVAALIAKEFKGNLPISYSGGADFYNIQKIFETGIKPITVATTILKPGGYARANQISHAANQITDSNKIDYKKLYNLADQVINEPAYIKKRDERTKNPSSLPLFNCGTASCTLNGCPINQQIPSYLFNLRNGDLKRAFEVVVNDNVLPSITGEICAHPCESNCTRLFYDQSVPIRTSKKIIADGAQKEYIDNYTTQEIISDKKICVIGAGPAGVSVASYLARNSVDVTVFEKENAPMGVVKHIIPDFRIAKETIDIDFELSKKYGVKYILDTDVDIDINILKQEYDFIVLAFGALLPGFNPLKEGKENVIDALEFLREDKKNKKDYGKVVGVIGGGDVAMDAARAAKRAGAQRSIILYRRTEAFMPASEEELNLAKEDGIEFLELVSPISYDGKTLILQEMQLSEFGKDGRRKVVSTNNTIQIEIDTLISATGATIDFEVFRKNQLDTDEEGYAVLSNSFETNKQGVYVSGDCVKGAKTIVEAMGNSKKIAISIMIKLGILPDFKFYSDKMDSTEAYDRKGLLFDKTKDSMPECLGCNSVCELCCDVCPNRANIAMTFEDQSIQILHIDGMCNECGNCAGFCPQNGDPYKDKFTVFWTLDDFLASKNSGFYITKEGEFIIRHEKVAVKHKQYVLEDPAVPQKVWDVIKRYLSDYHYTWIS